MTTRWCPTKLCIGELVDSHYFPGKGFCHSCKSWQGTGDALIIPTDREDFMDRVVTGKKLEAKTEEIIEEEDTPEVSIDPERCKDHPKYGVVRKPRSDCERCWELYALKHPDRMES